MPAPSQRPRNSRPPEIPAQPESGENGAKPRDELTLQSNAEGTAKRKRHRPKRLPQPVSGKPLDIGDTSRFLALGLAAVVVAVLAGVYYLYRSSKSVDLQIRTYKDPDPALSTPGDSAPKAGESAPAKKAAPAFQVNNPANRAGFHAFLHYMDWAYSAGVEWKSEPLRAKFVAEFSLAGVDDPEVREIHAQVLEFLRAGGSEPFSPKQGGEMIVQGPHGQGQLGSGPNHEKLKQINLRLKELTSKARQRYGEPAIKQAPDPAPEDRPRLAPGPAPDGLPAPEHGHRPLPRPPREALPPPEHREQPPPELK